MDKSEVVKKDIIDNGRKELGYSQSAQMPKKLKLKEQFLGSGIFRN